MKRISYFLMAFVFAASACFTACQKDETENKEATLDDFTGTYDVTIKVQNGMNGLLFGGETYSNISMRINAVSAATLERNIKTSYELLDAAAKSYLDTSSFDWRSEKLAEFSFSTSSNNGVDSLSWWPILTQVYGYVKDGYLYMASPDISGEKVLIFASRLGWHETGKSGNWTGYYLEKNYLMGLIEENANESFDYTKFNWSSVLTGEDYSILTFTATRK